MSEQDDYCGDCGWCADDMEDARLAPCPNCNTIVCFECRDKKGRCSHCAEYNMPPHVKFLTDQDSFKKRNISMSVMRFDGVGVHYWLGIEGMNKWDGKPINKDGEVRIDEKFDTPKQLHDYLLEFFENLPKRRKWYVSERYSSKNVRQWFYKEGD